MKVSIAVEYSEVEIVSKSIPLDEYCSVRSKISILSEEEKITLNDSFSRALKFSSGCKI